MDQQPLGKKLFLEFCASDLNLSRCMQFLTAVEELDIVVEGKKITTAEQIFEDFVSLEVGKWVLVFAGVDWFAVLVYRYSSTL